MQIYLKRFITKKELAVRVEISYSTLNRKLKQVPELTGMPKTSKADLLTSKEVTAFMRHFNLSPTVLEDIADIFGYPGVDTPEEKKKSKYQFDQISQIHQTRIVA